MERERLQDAVAGLRRRGDVVGRGCRCESHRVVLAACRFADSVIVRQVDHDGQDDVHEVVVEHARGEIVVERCRGV